MRKIAFPLLLLLVVCFSCKKDVPLVPVNGTITLSGMINGTAPDYYVYGFNFATGSTQKCYLTSSSADLVVISIQDPAGDVTGAFFENPQGLDAINLTDYNANLSSAEDLFTNYSEVVVTSFTSLTDTVKQGQLYTFRTAGSKYGKFLVKGVNIVANGSSQYAEVTIEWQFQPNGTTKF